MKKWSLIFLLLSLLGCVTPASQIDPKVNYHSVCATALGKEMISGQFSQIEILDGGAFLLRSASGRRVIVNGFCLAVELR
jgi:hypothetical protein